jgi:hypothetical protein
MNPWLEHTLAWARGLDEKRARDPMLVFPRGEICQVKCSPETSGQFCAQL